jgi:anti-sigma regulatory factor (Ser/Thr protein kinase)
MPATAASGQAPAAEQPSHPPATPYQRTFPGRADQVSQVRRDLARHLSGCPAAADAVLIASELAANAILHGRCAGQTFTVRCQLSPQAARIEVEDHGGPWRPRPPGSRPHGLDIIQALTSPDQWGTQATGTGGRIVWAQLTW